MSHTTLTRHVDSTNREIGQWVCHFCRCIHETTAQSDPLAAEIGFRLDRQAAMYSMLRFPRLMRTSLWLASPPTAASVAPFIAQLTPGTTGPKCCLWTA